MPYRLNQFRVIGDIQAESASNRQIQIPKDIVIHPDFDRSTFANDIGIILVCMAKEVTLTWCKCSETCTNMRGQVIAI